MLEDKVIIILGGAGLLGKSFILAVANAGGIVIAADIDKSRVEVAVEKISKESPSKNIFSDQVDITSKKSLQSLIDRTARRFGRIDCVVNNAYPRNKNYGRKLENVEYEDFCENISLHLGGYFLSMQQFADFFKKQGFGQVINISSIYGIVAPRFEIYESTLMTMPVEYAAIKSALQHLTIYFMRYHKGTSLRFNCLAPGGVRDAQPEGFINAYNKFGQSKGMLDPKDLCGTLLFLISDMSQFVNGQCITVDDGWSA